MFTNPFNKKYQTGGSAPTDDQKKDMQGFVTWIKSNVEGFKDKSEQEIAKSLSDMAKSDEGKKSVQDLYSRYQKSKKQKSKFADGGKFQDFICKHGRGGNVDCGCGGMVIRGQEGTQMPQNRYSGWQKQTRKWVTLPDGSTQAIEVIVSPDEQTGIQRIITDRSQMQDRGGMAVRDTVYGGGVYDNGKVFVDASQPLIKQEIKDLNDYLDSKPQSKQEGGRVSVAIPPMTYEKIEDVYGDGQDVGSGIIRPIIGENVMIDGRETFIPNRVSSAASRWGKDRGNIDVLYPGYGYASRGMVIYSPSEIAARKGDSLRDTARVQNPSGLVKSEQEGGNLNRRQVRREKRAAKALLRPRGQYTPEDVYQDALSRSRNYDQFRGMSRLERKNAINQIILGRQAPVQNSTGNQPDLGEDYIINETTMPYPLIPSSPNLGNVSQISTSSSSVQSKPSTVTATQNVVSPSTVRTPNLPNIPIEIENIELPELTVSPISDSDLSYIKPMRTKEQAADDSAVEMEVNWLLNRGVITEAEVPMMIEKLKKKRYSYDPQTSTSTYYSTPVAGVSNDAVPEGRLPNGALNNFLGRLIYGGYQHQLWEPYKIGPRTEKYPINKQGGQIEKPIINRFKNVLHK